MDHKRPSLRQALSHISSTYKAPLNKGGGDPQTLMLSQETGSGRWMVGIPPQSPLTKGGGKIARGLKALN